MFRRIVLLPMALLLSSCALPGTVQRLGVDYNTAIAGMADEVTLLNIVRAKESLPVHYTSFSRLTGSVTIKATGGFNSTLRDSAPTVSSSTSNAPTGVTVASGLSTLSGGTTYTPSVGGEVDTGPSFDINILESQAFYQGILTAVPATTAINFVSQGFDKRFVLSLLVQKIELRTSDDTYLPKGTVLLTLTNAHGYDDSSVALRLESQGFDGAIRCNDFADVDSPAQDIAPLSRVTHDAAGRTLPLKLDDLALFDGSTLKLSGTVPAHPSDDDKVMIQHPGANRNIRFIPNPGCNANGVFYSAAGATIMTPAGRVGVPSEPPPEPIYLGLGYAGVAVADPRTKQTEIVPAKVDLYITLRSTEGLIQFLGQCLQSADGSPPRTSDDLKCRVGDLTIFSVHKGEAKNALVRTSLLGADYAVVPGDPAFRNTMQTIGIIQKLIDLQQSSTQTPSTVPVHVVP